MKILILGGNGFIGFECARVCVNNGHSVTCMGRNIQSASKKLPQAEWISADLEDLQPPAKWQTYIADIDAIINCAGVLQQSPRDNIEAIQHHSLLALYQAALATGSPHLVQISANVTTGANAGQLKFLTTKAHADKALVKSGLSYTILRPALVVGRNAHGGTALIRAAASTPMFLPVPYPEKSCQTTDITELAEIAMACAEGKHGKAGDYCVASPDIITFEKLAKALRNWLGLDNQASFRVPAPVMTIGSFIADITAWFGWRSPMRSTAIKVMQDGILVDDTKPLLKTCSLNETLQQHPSGVQDIWFSRLYLLKPVAIIVLCLFWLISGVIALLKTDAATAYLSHLPLSPTFLNAMITATAVLDCVLGIAVLFRKLARSALIGICLLSLAYLISASLFAPNLWLDPIGPLVKVVPTIFLALMTLAILDER